jgi:hypothetical protein
MCVGVWVDEESEWVCWGAGCVGSDRVCACQVVWVVR